ncbi:MAG: hypothetical protein ACO25B_02240 [Chitinophagaceae bacterium]
MISHHLSKTDMIRNCLIFLFFLLTGPLAAQQKTYSWNARAGIDLPVGIFSRSHFPGIGAGVQYSKHRFGKQTLKPKKRMSFLLDAGGDYYFGKNVNTGGYPFKYSGYGLVHTYGGFQFRFQKKVFLSLAAGPGLGFYNGSTRFNIGTTLSGTYLTGKRTGLTPSFKLTRESGADWLAAFSIGGNWLF